MHINFDILSLAEYLTTMKIMILQGQEALPQKRLVKLTWPLSQMMALICEQMANFTSYQF